MAFVDAKMIPYLTPQYIQSEIKSGVFQGVVVDNCDPFKVGRVRVYSYQLHHDISDVKVTDLPWCQPQFPFTNSFAPPPLWSRVWLTFNTGNRKSPVYFGSWLAVPNGDGFLPFESQIGSEIPMEVRHYHNLCPEGTMIARSKSGNALWFEDKELNASNLFGAICMENTGGIFFRMVSYHQGIQPFQPNEELDDLNQQLPVNNVIRDGATPYTQPVTGAIELVHQNTSLVLLSSKDSPVEAFVQYKNGSIDLEEVNIAGDMMQKRQGTASLSMFAGTIWPTNTLAPNFKTVPKRWDSYKNANSSTGVASGSGTLVSGGLEGDDTSIA